VAKLTSSIKKEALAEGELRVSTLNGRVSIAVVRRTEEGQRVLYRLYLDDLDLILLAECLAKTLCEEIEH
jgi:hypothetical protein